MKLFILSLTRVFTNVFHVQAIALHTLQVVRSNGFRAGPEMAPPLKVNFRKALVFWVTSSDVTKFLKCENRGAGPRLLISGI